MFLGGFKSDMTGTKAMALEQHCRARGQAFLRFDYSGHGVSSGIFEDGCIGEWADDALAMFDHMITSNRQDRFILVGSSMGGWIMLLVALQRKKSVAGLLGIAAAPDFTEDLMRAGLSETQGRTLERDGRVEMPNDYDDEPYIITKKLLDDGRDHLLLTGSIELDIPVRLIQGMADTDVPWHTAPNLAKQLRSENVTVQLVKNGGHSLSDPRDLGRLRKSLDELLALVS
jgi:pimeloyl-ACP methyl ester carboxylesterase